MPDVLCYDDLDLYGRETDDELVVLEQDVVHMLLESWGTNLDAPTRSIGLEDALSAGTISGLKHRIETKLAEDARIQAAEVTLERTSDTLVSVGIRMQVNQDELGMSFTIDGNGNVTRTTT